MAWQIRARNYNTTPDNLALIPMSLLAFGGRVCNVLTRTIIIRLIFTGRGAVPAAHVDFHERHP